tara:strand:- start:160 stop:315 length:156 start_codon:yes stop_codon:yes gene_type:complete
MTKEEKEESKLILKTTSAGMLMYVFTVCKEIIIEVWNTVRNKKYYRRDIEE